MCNILINMLKTFLLNYISYCKILNTIIRLLKQKCTCISISSFNYEQHIIDNFYIINITYLIKPIEQHFKNK